MLHSLGGRIRDSLPKRRRPKGRLLVAMPRPPLFHPARLNAAEGNIYKSQKQLDGRAAVKRVRLAGRLLLRGPIHQEIHKPESHAR